MKKYPNIVKADPGGAELNLRTFEGRSFLRNIFQMPCLCGLSKIGHLTIKDFVKMLDYIEEHQQ